MRISRDEWGLRVAEVHALRSTCLRRSVGCFLVDADGYPVGEGYNGVEAGAPHCGEGVARCPALSAPSGADLDGCNALHAEWNALIRCRDVRRIDACYVTVSPCVTCTKMLMNTSCRRIVFRSVYEAHVERSRALWLTKVGRRWECIP